MKFLIENNVDFTNDESGSYIATVKIEHTGSTNTSHADTSNGHGQTRKRNKNSIMRATQSSQNKSKRTPKP
jgi:hypothetical protein